MPDIRAVIFDLGGVMVRLVWHRAAFRRLAENARLSPDEAFGWFGADGRAEALNRGALTPARLYRDARDAFGLTLSEEEFRAGWTAIFEPHPGMSALFAEVAARVPVGILSDTDPWHWAALETLLAPAVARVAHPTLSFREGLIKPDAALYRRAAGHVGMPPSACLFIDDRPGNVDGARAVGMDAVRFVDADTLRRDLRARDVLPPA